MRCFVCTSIQCRFDPSLRTVLEIGKTLIVGYCTIRVMVVLAFRVRRTRFSVKGEYRIVSGDCVNPFLIGADGPSVRGTLSYLIFRYSVQLSTILPNWY